MPLAEIARWEGLSHAELWCAHWSGANIIVGSIDENVRTFTWDGKALAQHRVLPDHTLGVVSVDSFGTNIAACTMEGKILIHTEASGEPGSNPDDARRAIDVGPGQCWQVRYSPDGKFLATGGQHGVVKVYSTATGNCEHDLSGASSKMVYSVAYSQKCIAAGAGDGSLAIYDTATLKLSQRIQAHAKPIRGVCFSADGDLVFSCADDGVLSVFNVESGSLVHSFSGHSGPIYCVALSAEGMLASSSADRTVKLWNLQTKSMIHQFASSHTDQVWGCSFSDTGKELVSAGADGVLVVYDTNAL